MERQNSFTHRKSERHSFVIIDKFNIEDPRLSWKAKGILHYILSKPDDWQVYEKDIIKHAADGRDSVRAGIKELIKNGYMIRRKKRNAEGKFCGYHYDTYEIPVEVLTEDGKSGYGTEDGKSVNGKSNNGKSAPTNNELTNNELTKQQQEQKPCQEQPPEQKQTQNYSENVVVDSFKNENINTQPIQSEKEPQEKLPVEIVKMNMQLEAQSEKKFEQEEKQDVVDIKTTEEVQEKPPAEQEQPKKAEMIFSLIDIGVERKKALELAEEFTPARIGEVITYTKVNEKIRNKPGFAVDALINDWQLPAAVGQADRAEKLKKKTDEYLEEMRQWKKEAENFFGGQNPFAMIRQQLQPGG